MQRKSKVNFDKGVPIFTTPKMRVVNTTYTKTIKPDWDKCNECNEKGCFLCNTNHTLVKEILEGNYGVYKKNYLDGILYSNVLITYYYRGRFKSVYTDRHKLLMAVREKMRRELVALYRQYVRNGYWDTIWFLSGRCPRCEDPTVEPGKCNVPFGVRENARCIHSYGIVPDVFVNNYGSHNKMLHGFVLVIKRKKNG